jgi:hypothetical protein
MTVEERVADFLVKNMGKAYCNTCVARELGINHRQAQEERYRETDEHEDQEEPDDHGARHQSKETHTLASFFGSHRLRWRGPGAWAPTRSPG